MEKFAETPVSNVYFPQGYSTSLYAWQRYQMRRVQIAARAQSASTRLGDRVAVARELADQMNTGRDSTARNARAGELLAMGLLTDILRYIAENYCRDASPLAMSQTLQDVRDAEGPEVADRPLQAFFDQFPPEPVRAGETPAQTFLNGTEHGLPHRERVAIEWLLLVLTNGNKALAPYRELHDDSRLRKETPYERLYNAIEKLLAKKPPVPGTGLPLLETLWAPIRFSPDSVEEQLKFVRMYWQPFLPETLLQRLEIAWGVLQEEVQWRGQGPGPVQAMEFGQLNELGYEEFEAFSLDRDWMPNLVLIAKSVYVWLDQLSKKFLRPISRLDQVPDDELDLLAHWGFSGIWLIGIWERSEASRTIKRMSGNPEALASAYSLFDYEVAQSLGGEAAFRNLAGRAMRRGIRLASDMVPNHVGLYSKWICDHPEWFIQQPFPPYPSYRFSGPDLSLDARVGLFIEDGYWDRRDAAVVFKRVDRWSGDTRFIYHGNDGTNMPWNDTAQLDFTIPAVREAVMQAILHVARLTPIIRFDAAMTLAKRHYQRLWFPKPGDAGAVPSRAEHGMSRAEFDQVFPNEFWRDVVDRLAAEAPDTLLLAEAFWLMEGYFVRTLGMHRVYNSAFMNMLKLEENVKYRQTIKNVLEFSPEVLQRFVNFMNNPDEDTAVAQFGKGDKYFGIAMMMVTMPGLPMFGHGQIEGYAEKYGMEYARAYWEELPDRELMARHEREIFPLMRKRHLFSGARHFALFDFITPDGWVDENVYAYSNRMAGERALILFNNSFYASRGVVHTSTAINEGPADEPRLRRINLEEALELNTADTAYYIYRDSRSGMEFLRYARDIAENGLHLELQGYEYQALVDWREIHDLDRSWGRLHGLLAGQGVPSIEEAYQEMHLSPILAPYRRLMCPEILRLLAQPGKKKAALLPFQIAFKEFLDAVGHRINRNPDIDAILQTVEDDLSAIRGFAKTLEKETFYPEALAFLKQGMPIEKGMPLDFWRVPLVWSVVRQIGAAAAPTPYNGFDLNATSAAWLREWFLTKPIARAFQDLDGDPWRAAMDARLVRIAVAYGGHFLALQLEPWAPLLDAIFRDPDVRAFLNLHRFAGHRWFNKEQWLQMLYMIFFTLCLARRPWDDQRADELMLCLNNIQILIQAAQDAGYDFDRMFNAVK